ncbi:MAG: hypothetical protein JSW62_03020 [Thermoplasmatales archaeon]|nr:MAG: hypothetical protein JSW62_03020 [Thermoplasmatales archaeon]
MDKREIVNDIDKKMQEGGWKFLGAILHYKKAWKEQASIYEKEGKYIVSGLDLSGEKELRKPISKEEAKKRLEISIKEIKKFMFGISK